MLSLQDKYEEVDMITKGGNYGWHYYEGTLPFNPSTSSKNSNSTTKIANPIFPVMWYNHSDINQQEGSASITGGYFYRSSTDPCLYGTYVLAHSPCSSYLPHQYCESRTIPLFVIIFSVF